MAESKKPRRPAPQRAIDLVAGMRLREMKAFAQDLRRDEPEAFAVLLSYMTTESDVAALTEELEGHGFSDEEMRLRRAEEQAERLQTATEIAALRPQVHGCLGCKRGYKTCPFGEYGTVPNAPSNRCRTCHHDSDCHGRAVS